MERRHAIQQIHVSLTKHQHLFYHIVPCIRSSIRSRAANVDVST